MPWTAITMVLLTMTPAMIDAIYEYQALTASEPSAVSIKLADEQDLENPTVGKPISHGQVVDLSTTLLQHHKSHDRTFHLDHLLRGSTLYVPPPKPKPEPVSVQAVAFVGHINAC